ncbi:NAD(P)-dependent oxidoreductase [Tepidanaerobacter syntrophicus]|uniref:dTDP-4-dehydrorhamnose reductase n=1 Tax=Tepidanaerobacter syntrophicus TaxID=224999 RepID=UPI0022EDE0DD|nr:dTDP-4-dehydrorhamnose reductase [Tepidanaerobacter syntrophicus]GLI19873.1 NAD(P)-dependent oxidoreductase [Tepidanaerobacter syntrophicus]
MKILVTGCSGQLGYDVIRRLEDLKIDCLGASRKDFDLTNELDTKNFIKNYKPDAVVHCAAYTAVDKAEDERDICYRTNVLGTRYIAQACKDIDAKILYISTDYVFDGKGDKPFEVTDIPNSINYYGKTKYEGELEVQKYVDKAFIVRISWVFGENGNNFVKTMLRLSRERRELSVVSDQIGSPTYTFDLAKLISDMITTEKYGIYHATNEGYCSWHEFASAIFDMADINIKLNPIRTEDYPTKALRPKNSRLSKKSLDLNGFQRLPHWKNALEEYIKITL